MEETIYGQVLRFEENGDAIINCRLGGDDTHEPVFEIRRFDRNLIAGLPIYAIVKIDISIVPGEMFIKVTQETEGKRPLFDQTPPPIMV